MGKLKPKDFGLKKPFTEEMAKGIIATCAEAPRAPNKERADHEEKMNKWIRALAQSYGEYYDLDETFKDMDNYEVTKEFLAIIGLALLNVSGKSFVDLNEAVQWLVDNDFGIYKPEYDADEPTFVKISPDSEKYLNDIEETALSLVDGLELWRVIVEPNTEPSDTVAQGARGAPSCKCGTKKRT